MSVPTWKHGEELKRVESGVDFGVRVGYFVRLSVIRDDGGTEWVGLTPDEADLLADQLRKSAAQTREAQARWEEDRAKAGHKPPPS
jgi:hypothetical protein